MEEIQIIKKYIDNQDTDKLNICLIKKLLFKYEDEVIGHCIKTRNINVLIYLFNNGLEINDIQEDRLYLAAYQQHYDILYYLLAMRKWSKTILGGVIVNAGPCLFKQDSALLDLIYNVD